MDLEQLSLEDASEGHGKTLRRARGRDAAVRRQREFTPQEKKDTVYWEKRRKNNEAARRSREKRRLKDEAVEGRLAVLLEENARLRAELRALKLHFGLLPAAGGPPTLPLQALLWDVPWTGGSNPGAEPLPSASAPSSCLLRPCSLNPGVPGCRGCLAAHRWTGRVTSARYPQELALPAPSRIDKALQITFPAALFSCHLLDGHLGPRPELRPCWGLWSPMSTGCRASGSSDVLLTSAADPMGLSPGVTCPSTKGLAQPSLPHKLRIKSRALSREPRGWESGQGPC
ncbi:NFIL3 like protein [Choloepus didactylus]|uniref:NFIL3 like protein n=1 Tax=Choloepus didactylus TaxID=27675 RepID=UPI00189D3CE2|nr:NFIL3 like protein [Choloepus didactylus]